MVQQFGVVGVVKNFVVIVMFVCFVVQLVEEDVQFRRLMMQLLDGWFRYKSEMVNFEVVKVICDMWDVIDVEVLQVVYVFQFFFIFFCVVIKFVVFCILYNIVLFKFNVVNVCNFDIEFFIFNSNCFIVIFVIIILFKIGNEVSVDCFMK